MIRRVTVVLNRESGTLLTLGLEDVSFQIKETLQQHGVDCHLHAVDGAELEETLKKARDDESECTMIGGGDGSIATAAQIFSHSHKALGILPLGTFNLAARDLEIPLDLIPALETLLVASIRDIDLMMINGSPCLCVAVLGFYPSMALRQNEYHGNWIIKCFKSMISIFQNLMSYTPLRLTISTPDPSTPPQTFRTRFAILANNDYTDSIGIIPKKTTFDKGQATAHISTHQSRWQYACSLFAWLMGRWKQDDHIISFSSSEILIDTKIKKKLPIMRDGEIEKMQSPIQFKILPKAVRVLAPQTQPQSTV